MSPLRLETSASSFTKHRVGVTSVVLTVYVDIISCWSLLYGVYDGGGSSASSRIRFLPVHPARSCRAVVAPRGRRTARSSNWVILLFSDIKFNNIIITTNNYATSYSHIPNRRTYTFIYFPEKITPIPYTTLFGCIRLLDLKQIHPIRFLFGIHVRLLG